jgi:ATP adenylyltransferase
MTEPENKCPFCPAAVESKIVERFGSVIAIEDKNPVTKGHLLVIPVRHAADYFSMSFEEIEDADKLIRILRDKIEKSDSTVRGFNIGVNCGECAGQTIMHAHIHLIPRRFGDTPEPKGGVRGVIPGKRKY